MTVVDRAQSAVLSLEYTIPYEDTEVTADEVPGSRRHQFIALCRDHSRQELLPNWVTWKDVDAAVAKNLIDAVDVTDEDVLETSTTWENCWYRITADEARRPITFTEAMQPVAWDTTALPTGAYAIQGYTYEPAFNIFIQRPGVVHVVDDFDFASTGPAAAVTTTLDYTFYGDPFVIEGCVRAMPGSTMSGYWALTDNEPLDWQPFAEGVAFAGDAFSLPFLPPPGAEEETVVFRVDITDPMQRTFVAHGNQLLTVIPGNTPSSSGCEDGVSFIAEPCVTGGMDTSGSTASGTSVDATGEQSSGSSTTSGPQQMDTGGCACAANRAPGAVWAWLLFLSAWRRRKSTAVRIAPANGPSSVLRPPAL